MQFGTRAIVITGASSGLGAALAEEYAQAGRTLGLIARNKRRLDDVAARCADAGARCVTGSIDVTDRSALGRWIEAFEGEQPIDLMFVNAGVYAGHGPCGQMETIDEALWQIRTNLEGAVITSARHCPACGGGRAGTLCS